MKNYEPALSKETLKTVDNKIKQSKKKRSKSLLGNRLENLSINSVCPYLTLFNLFNPISIALSISTIAASYLPNFVRT